MNQSELKMNQRVYHPIFKWGTLCMPPNQEKSLVEFDFKECSYYIIGKGYKDFKKENGDNIIYLPNEELWAHEISGNEIPAIMQLKIKALNATIKL